MGVTDFEEGWSVHWSPSLCVFRTAYCVLRTPSACSASSSTNVFFGDCGICITRSTIPSTATAALNVFGLALVALSLVAIVPTETGRVVRASEGQPVSDDVMAEGEVGRVGMAIDSLAVSGGVHTTLDVVQSVMTGAHAVQLVSCLLKRGPSHLATLKGELTQWLEEHEYHSLRQMQGSMNLEACPDAAVYERANYMLMLQSWRTSH